MNKNSQNWAQLGAVIFTLAALVAPFYSTIEYDWVSQATGELAGRQNMNSWIMRAGLVGLGFCFFIDALQDKQGLKRDWPFVLFGLAMIGAGLYRRTSVEAGVFIDEPFANGHGWFFIASTLFLLLGLVMHMLLGGSKKQKFAALVTVIALISCTYAAFTVHAYVGLFDRIAYCAVFVWVLVNPRVPYGNGLDHFTVSQH